MTIVMVSGLSFSCKKWVELPLPKDRILAEVVFADSATAMNAIAAIYSNFGYFNHESSNSINGQNLTIYPGLSADELSTTIALTGIDTKQFEDNALIPVNAFLLPFWSTGYAGIYRVNACIKGISESKGIRDELKQRLIGEIKVARALYYFHLVNFYGGVPLVTTTDFADNAKLPRASINDIYQLIIADLTEARQVLKSAYPSAGRARPNLYVATALLAKVNLYRENWSVAEGMAKEIINSGVYSLVADPNNVFVSGSNEAIWQSPTEGGQQVQTQEGSTLIPASATDIPRYYLTQSLLSAFEPNDQRKTKWAKANIIGANTYYYPFKYKNRAPTASPREDYMLFRLAEQYLILAEALARQNKLSEALPYLNMVRTRAGLAAVNPATQTDLLNAITQERRVELFCERGNRWFDLKRTGSANAVLGALKPSTWQPEDTLYPIPYTERLYNPFLVQNPGYN